MKSIRVPRLFRGVHRLEWKDIPQFAVICGANGVGKSQLLQLLAIAHGAAPKPVDAPHEVPEIETAPRPKLVGYVPPNWLPEVSPTGPELFEAISTVHDFIEGVSPPRVPLEHADAVAGLRESAPQLSRDPAGFNQLISRMAAVDALRYGLALEERAGKLGAYGAVIYQPDRPLQTLAEIFYAYAAAAPEERPAREPWEIANDLLRELAVRFTLVPPPGHRFRFTLQCRVPRGNRIAPSSLSSGEQTALLLVAVVICTTHLSGASSDVPATPDLLLLDEPDAHLHTSLIGGLLAQLRTLSEKGTQIIMSTHRSETIMLAPAGSLFVMKQRGPVVYAIEPPPSREALVAGLAADLVAVLPGVRVVLVEDEDDRSFHQGAYELAQSLPGASLPPIPPLAFMPVMSKPDKDGKRSEGPTGDGGWTAVVKRMREFREQGLRAVFRGLVDGDDRKATLPSDVLRLDRYSIESYWADPLGLYQWAVFSDTSMGKDIAKAGGIALTELNDLRSLDVARLQRAADAIITRVETTLPPDQPRDRRDVTLLHASNSVVLQYPTWLWTTPKRILTDAITRALTDGVHNGWKKSLRAVGIVPTDLIDIYRRLITERL